MRRANAKTQHLWRRNCAVPAERSATTRRVSPPSDESPPRIQTSGAFTLHAAPSPWTAARCLRVNPEPVNRRSRQPLKPVKQPSDHGDRPEDDTGQKAIPEIPRAHFPADGAARPAAAAQDDTGLQRQERGRDADQPDENATDCDFFLLEHTGTSDGSRRRHFVASRHVASGLNAGHTATARPSGARPSVAVTRRARGASGRGHEK